MKTLDAGTGSGTHTAMSKDLYRTALKLACRRAARIAVWAWMSNIKAVKAL